MRRGGVLVPFPSAVDDHQTTNARFLVERGGGWLMQQRDLTPAVAGRAARRRSSAPSCSQWRAAAKRMRQARAPRDVVAACEELADAHEAQGQAHPFRRHRRRRHERHRRGAASTWATRCRAPICRDSRHRGASRSLGIKISMGHAASHIDGADAVVMSTAVQADNPEVHRRARAPHPGRAARDDAGRADAPEAGHRHRRHARQDDDHQPGRERARRRRARPDLRDRRPPEQPRAPTRGWAAATTSSSRPTSRMPRS